MPVLETVKIRKIFKSLVFNLFFILDILFLIYLYQTWIYPVDMKRANEFGQVYENEKNETFEEIKDENLDKNKPDRSNARKRLIKT